MMSKITCWRGFRSVSVEWYVPVAGTFGDDWCGTGELTRRYVPWDRMLR